MKNHLRSNPGFTIVELLIVIVVIAILATMSIVAYNGIQSRAKNTQTETAAAWYRKTLIAYALENGSYPNSNTSSCLGESSAYPDGTCFGASGYNAAFITDLKTWLKSSTVQSPNTDCLPMYSGCRRALAYTPSTWPLDGTSHSFWMIYVLRNNAKCTIPGLSGGTWANPTSTPNANGWTEQHSGTSLCRVILPDPSRL
jgi:prepilin-type N-terminal cleavage/methylation domain-containing protein